MTREAEVTAVLIRVSGIVQGVGFRPFVHRVARKSGVSGYVRNMGGSEVEVLAEGSVHSIARFLNLLLTEGPPPARIEELSFKTVPYNGIDGFSILPSGREAKLKSMIPPDIAVCEDCLKEVYDPADRHYRYAFNSCAWCGPRFSMMASVPYDRENTSMIDFPMCEDCMREYEDPDNVRRFHAQGISCPNCGPRLWLEDSEGRMIEAEDPLIEAAKLIEEGRIVALKGVGGYHIACLATDDGVVEELRRRKRRPTKPFALMALDIEIVKQRFEFDERAEHVLTSPERPIVLLRPKEGNGLSELIAPGLSTIGVMLPYTPLHHMLLNETEDKILIMTSGNEHGKPMCTDEECARSKLTGIVDYFLHHDRRIVSRVDDSVVRFTAGRLTMLRRGRGYAPVWIRLPFELEKSIIAFGAELQSAGAVAFDDKVVLTQYIGDVDELDNLDFLERMLEFFADMYMVDPSEALLVSDMHPSYSSTLVAERWASKYGAELVRVQHHHAHIASVMVEARVDPGDSVLGVAVDGLGYGDDGTLWGGEVLLATYGGYERIGHLAPQPMPGGDRATRYPVRMLIGILSRFMDDSEIMEVLSERNLLRGLPGGEGEARIAIRQARRSDVMISSVGRVLDAISSLLNVCLERTYEGEPAMRLEAAAEGGRIVEDLELPVASGGVVEIPKLIESLLNASAPVRDLAYTSIFLLGEALGRVALANLSRASVSDTVFVSGGAAVNSILIEGMESVLSAEGVRLILNSRVPAGDGGIALGQVAVAGVRNE